ncbi:hypothetical protein GCM10009037_00730 [Halarchaeum grantii]|uniref:DUF3054 domain-containing protein n=1 Tax=Halarchaeum grantii TaxID=1193105 RepID=A0A830F4V6_9EURY|nr:DUF3054 domain-containing protein [Halarchaeum grantii]GGL21326.1 hypothetical protein GCM10009037_00730 [Halarchaeum grantii]
MSLLDVDRRTLRLFALPDAAAILAFVLVGEYQHSMLAYSLTHPLRLVGVLLPFVGAWAVVAPALRAYSARARSWRGLLGWTVLSWLVADALAQALLASRLFPIDFDPIFAVVVAVFGTLFLLVARGLAFAVATWR